MANNYQATTYTDKGLQNGTNYYYRVKTSEPAGDSAYSTAIQAKPSAALSFGINCGGGNVDSRWLGDMYYSGGNQDTWTGSVSVTGLSSPAPQNVLLTNRVGNLFSYTIAHQTPGSTSKVRLHFAEFDGGQWGLNRYADVLINGTKVLTNFNIYNAAGGVRKAVIREFNTVVGSDGNVKIDFQSGSLGGSPIINGIEIIPQEVILFSDDFNDGDATGWTTDGGTWSVVNGEYKQTNATATANTFAGNTTWTDYSFESKIKNGSGGVAFGVFFRATNTANNYNVIYNRERKDWKLYKKVADVNTQIGSTYLQTWTNDTYKTVKVRCVGSNIVVSVDGVDIITATDSTYSSGKVGFRTYANSGTFDDVVVKQ
ncbi:MAG: DUF1080 domain-containing protein [Hyphomonadaceae bacterium]|nr:DUF1080 domain-containing protein [Clostridia bacterium]